MSHVDQGPLAAYNSLADRHLSGYFSNTRMRRHLHKAGLITKYGEIVSENTYRLNMSRKEHKKYVKDMLAQAIVHKTLDLERTRQAEIKKKLEEIAKIELVRRVRASRHRKREADLLPILSPRSGSRPASSQTDVQGKQRYRPLSSPCKKGRRPISALSSNYDDEDEVVVYLDDEGRPITPAHVDESDLRFASRDPIDTRHLYSLDTTALRKYAMLMAKMEQGHGLSSPYIIPQVPLPPKSPRSGRTPRSAQRYKRGEGSQSCSPKRPSTANQAYLHPAGSPKRYRGQQETMCEVAMCYHGSNLSLSREQFDKRQDIIVEQQHCGGNTLTVFRDKLEPDTKFSFISYRHRGYPFSLTIYIDGKMDCRVSTCCEYRHQKGGRIGGKNGHFSILKIHGAVPCYKCQVEKGVRIGNQAPRPKLKRPPQHQEEVVVVETKQESPRSPTPEEKPAPDQKEEILVPVDDDVEDKKPNDKYEDDFEGSSSRCSSSSSESEKEEAPSGLEVFQPRDARGVEKATGRVDIHDDSGDDSDKDDRGQTSNRHRSKSGSSSSSSSTSSSSSASSDKESDNDSEKRGKIKPRPRVEKPKVDDDRGKPVVVEPPPDAGEGKGTGTTKSDQIVLVKEKVHAEPMPPKVNAEAMPPPQNDQITQKSKEEEKAKPSPKFKEDDSLTSVYLRGRRDSVSSESSAASSSSSPNSSSDDYSDSENGEKAKLKKQETGQPLLKVESNKKVDLEVAVSEERTNWDSRHVVPVGVAVYQGEEFGRVKNTTPVTTEVEEAGGKGNGRETAVIGVENEERDTVDQAAAMATATATVVAEATKDGVKEVVGELIVEEEEKQEQEANVFIGADVDKEEQTLVEAELDKEEDVAADVADDKKEDVVIEAAGNDEKEGDNEEKPKRRDSASSSSSSVSSVSSSSSSGSATINDQGPNTVDEENVVARSSLPQPVSLMRTMPRRVESVESRSSPEPEVGTPAPTRGIMPVPASSVMPAPVTKERKGSDSGSSSDSSSDSNSSSESDSEEDKKGPTNKEVIADVHKWDNHDHKTQSRPDEDSDLEATHGGNDPDNVANNLNGTQPKGMPTVAPSQPRPGSILPLLEKSQTTVEIKGVTLNKTQVYEAAQFLETKDKINQLNLVNCGIDDDDVQKLMEALKESPSSPVLLNLSLNPLTSGCVEHILDIVRSKPSIEAVLLQGTRLGDDGVEKLVDGILALHDEKKRSPNHEEDSKELRELDLSDSKIGDAGAQAVARLIQSEMEIDTLTLSSNHAISVEGWWAIGDALRSNSNLETLTLDHNVLGDEGVENITSGLYNNTSVTAIDLNDVGMTEAGGKYVMELLKRNTTILEITLIGNRISEKQHEDIQKYIALNKTIGSGS